MAKLIYLGHASFLLKSKDYSIVIDPYQNESVPNMKFPKVPGVDLVVCSHTHFDHNARELVSVKRNPTYVERLTVCVPHDDAGGRKRGMNDINIFNLDGYKVVHMGDTGCVLDEKTLLPLKNCDVLLAPINGYFTIGPNELKKIVDIVKPRILIPMHYFMPQYQSGYPDGNMIALFKKVFPDYQETDEVEIDLEKYKDYQGVLILNKYLQ